MGVLILTIGIISFITFGGSRLPRDGYENRKECQGYVSPRQGKIGMIISGAFILIGLMLMGY